MVCEFQSEPSILRDLRFISSEANQSVVNTGLATSKRFVLVLGLLMGLVAFAIDISLPAIPLMVTDLATNMSLGQQIVGMFIAGMAAGQLPAGLVSDRIGRLPVLYTGIGLFTIAGIATSISDNITLMLWARFIQGLGASSGMVLARAIVRDVTSGVETARLMSILVMIFTAAPMIAPMLGSFIVTQWGWRAPFVVTTISGVLILYAINTSLRETGTPSKKQRIGEQLRNSVKEFFSHRQCIFGLMMILATISGIMTLVGGSSALIMEIYGFPVAHFGYLFALTGVAILIGSTINKRLLRNHSTIYAMGVGAAIAVVAGLQLLVMAWLGEASFVWVWGCICLFMCSTGLLLPNATATALDPVPAIAGVAASIIGTIQSGAGAISAIVSNLYYVGTISNVALVVGVSGVSTGLIFLVWTLAFPVNQPD